MISTLWTRLAIVLALVVCLASGAAADIKLRKNIDRLTPEELAAYKHAIQILMDRSAVNPYDRSGYLWQAWIHNCPFIRQPDSGVGSHSENCDPTSTVVTAGFVAANPGICEHGKDLFLIWHRAQFYYFEHLLQATDPDGKLPDSRSNGATGPSTSNVTVPFWNWTRPPSGDRFPKAFEKEGTLFRDGRESTPFAQDKDNLKDMMSGSQIADLVFNAAWPVFGGLPQDSPTDAKGQFESDHHDLMHAVYIGGVMKSPSTAALDPIFFSFHSYIDLVLQLWLDEHGSASVTSLNNFLRATQPDSVPPAPDFNRGAGDPSMGQGKIYLNLANLGYGYEVTDDDKLPRPQAVAALLMTGAGVPAKFGETEKSPHARLAGNGVNNPATRPPTLVSNISVPVPNNVGSVRAVFSRPMQAPDVSYAIDFYLHPTGVSLNLGNKADRDRYIVVARGHFGSGGDLAHTGHDTAKPVSVDLTTPLKDLVATGHGGETWALTAVVSGLPPDSGFGTLSLAP